MAGYYLYAKQFGQGCDYTIGCGETLIPLKSTAAPGINAEIREIVADHGFGTADLELEELTLLQHVKDLDVEEWMPEDEEDPEKEARRAQYEQLKREFGD